MYSIGSKCKYSHNKKLGKQIELKCELCYNVPIIKTQMSGEPRVTSQPDDDDKDLHPDLKAWRDSIPVVSAAEQAEAVRVAKEYSEKSRELADRINKARDEYYRIYEKDPDIWRRGLDKNFQYLLTRLEEKGITFTEPEKIILKTTLSKSTVTMKTLRPDYVDDPNKPDPLKASPNDSKKVK